MYSIIYIGKLRAGESSGTPGSQGGELERRACASVLPPRVNVLTKQCDEMGSGRCGHSRIQVFRWDSADCRTQAVKPQLFLALSARSKTGAGRGRGRPRYSRSGDRRSILAFSSTWVGRMPLKARRKPCPFKTSTTICVGATSPWGNAAYRGQRPMITNSARRKAAMVFPVCSLRRA